MKIQAVVLIFITTMSVLSVKAQELDKATASLQQSLQEVQTSSKAYKQSISSPSPGKFHYGYEETDQKGNTTKYLYEFSLSDVDPYAVRENTQKDVIQVVLAIKNKQKLVKVFKNEEVQPYTDELKIFAKDIENARAIRETIKNAIPAAEKAMANRLNLTGYDAMINWLTSNVKDVNLGSKSYAQKLSKGEHVGSVLYIVKESDAKTTTEEEFVFNLADINPHSVVFKVSGNKLAINFETVRKVKYISYKKNGELKPYTNDISIYTNDVDEARDLKNVLDLVIPLAVDKVQANLKASIGDKNPAQQIKSLLTTVSIGSSEVTQSLEGDCMAVFTQVEKDPKKTETHVYNFNWMDVNPTATVIDVSGDKLFINLLADDSRKLFTYTKNGLLDGYEKQIKFYALEAERARKIKYAVDRLIETCKSSYKPAFSDNVTAMIFWLKSNIKDVVVEDVTQKQMLESVEGDNKLKLTRLEVNAKGSGAEEVYEFNLTDINPQSVTTDVKGKWLLITLETNQKSKIIKYYKDGKIQPYAAKLELYVSDIERSRNAIQALKASIERLKK